MLKLGDLELTGKRPLIAVSFSDIDSKRDVAAAREAGVAIAELRIDLFARLTPDYVLLQAERLSGLPTIATIRLEAEGGRWKGADADRIAIFEAVLPQVDAIDIELRSTAVVETLAPKLKAAGKLLILSHHDFEKTPDYEALTDICHRAEAAGADIVKIAAMAQNDTDIATLARLLAERPAPNLVVIGMGEAGTPSRVAFAAKGSLFTFAAKGDRASAPGQIGYEMMLRIFSELPIG